MLLQYIYIGALGSAVSFMVVCSVGAFKTPSKNLIRDQSLFILEGGNILKDENFCQVLPSQA